MPTKKYKVLIAEIDGVDLANNQEHALNTSDALFSMGAMVATPEYVTVSASTLALTATSNTTQLFTGSVSGQIMTLPDATTLALGHTFDVWNFSTENLAIKNYAATLLATLKPNGKTIILLRDNSTTAGVWGITYTLDNGNIFGTQLYYVDENTETSTTSTTTWLNKITLITPALPSGDYLVQYQFIWRASGSNKQLNVRVRRGGVDIEQWAPFTSTPDDRQLLSGFIRVAAISGAQTFTLDFKFGSGSTGTVYMQKARLFVWRIS